MQETVGTDHEQGRITNKSRIGYMRTRGISGYVIEMNVGNDPVTEVYKRSPISEAATGKWVTHGKGQDKEREWLGRMPYVVMGQWWGSGGRAIRGYQVMGIRASVGVRVGLS